MTGAFAGRDQFEVDALVTDRYLEGLLAAHARGADRGPSAATPDDAISLAADRLARDLPRFHPSFRFEEALAARLADAAVRLRHTEAADPAPATRLIAFPEDRLADLLAGALGGPGVATTARGRRPLLIGGALTSAAISLAGAAYVAWRLNRPADGAMARAVRAVARSRPV